MSLVNGRVDDFKEISKTDWDPQVETIYATRKFVISEKVAEDGFEIVGVTHKKPLSPGVNVADCKKVEEIPEACHLPGSVIPIEGCSCGWYAYDQSNYVWEIDRNDRNVVEAVVELSGKIIVCDRGVKAEKLRLVAIALYDNTPAKTLLWVNKNFPDVEVFATRDEMFKSFPLSQIERPETVNASPDFYLDNYSSRLSLNAGGVFNNRQFSKAYKNSNHFFLSNLATNSSIDDVKNGNRIISNWQQFNAAIRDEIKYRRGYNKYKTNAFQKIAFTLSTFFGWAFIALVAFTIIFSILAFIPAVSAVQFETYRTVVESIPIIGSMPYGIALAGIFVMLFSLGFVLRRLSGFKNTSYFSVENEFSKIVPYYFLPRHLGGV